MGMGFLSMSIHQFTGGAAALALPPQIAIRPPEWWEAKYSLSADLVSFSKYITNDSFDHYTLGLGVVGNAAMGEATGKAAYYDRAYFYLQSLIDIAVPVAGGYKGWYSAYYGGAETSLNEIYCWRFAPDLLLPTKNILAYAERWAAVQAFLEDNIWSKWYTRGINANIYRSVLHIASHWAKLALYLRTEGSTATIRAQADAICAAISHAGIPYWNGASIYQHIRKFPHPVGGANTAFWPAYWTGTVGAGGSEPYGSDCAHGVAIGTFVSAALRAGYGPWSVDNDLPRLIRLRDIIYSPGVCWNTLAGAAGQTTWAGKLAEFGRLAQFDRAFQTFLENDEARGVAAGSEKWGTFALNAARLGGPYL